VELTADDDNAGVWYDTCIDEEKTTVEVAVV
jgi:hypothetical protein